LLSVVCAESENSLSVPASTLLDDLDGSVEELTVAVEALENLNHSVPMTT
jgi:hypothetical protein